MKKILMNSQHLIEVIGSGTNTFGKEGGQYRGDINGDTTELKAAIEAGYRHFDTAISYRNEAVVAKAIKESGISREEFFITSKIPPDEQVITDNIAIEKHIQDSLTALEMDYIDLYLIHHPASDEDNLRVWKVLEEYHQKGVLKSIGVSNFNQDQLTYITKHADIPIAVNQIQSHPGLWQDDLIEFCQSRGIVVEAWGPLSGVSAEAKAQLADIGQKYQKTWVQVILNYQVNRDVVVIPKSHNAQRQIDNLNVLDFELTLQETETIKSL